MKKAWMIILLGFVCLSVFSQECKVKSGVIAGVSVTGYQDKQFSGNSPYSLPDMRFSFHVGYQFQFELKNRFSLDAALLYGQKRGEMKSSYGFGATPLPDYTEKFSRNYLALNGVVNYNIIGGFKLGVGVEPTIHFNDRILVDNTIKSAFDIPVVVKATYSFKYFDVALMYKQGTCNVLKGIPSVKSGRTSDFQLSIFVPIFR